jgi:integrase
MPLLSRSKRGAPGAITYYVKAPNEAAHRHRFYIFQRKDGKAKAVDSAALDAVNAEYRNSRLTKEQTAERVEAIKHTLQKEEERRRGYVVHSSDNAALLDTYLAKHYPASYRTEIDFQTCYNRLRRAIEALGPLSLLTASQQDLDEQLARIKRPNLRRAAISAIRQLLGHAGRNDVVLRMPDAERPRVRWLSKDELEKLLPNISDPVFRCMCGVAFYTGLRKGEIFGLSASDYFNGRLNVQQQLDTEFCLRETKTGRTRRTYILPGGEKYVEQWLDIANQEKLAIRNIRHSDLLTPVAEKLFRDPLKHVVFHDLRHSYAAFLVSHGVSMTLTAQSLGNSVIVCEKYYSGFVLVDEAFITIDRIIRANT